MAHTGQTREEVAWGFDLPLLAAWNRMTGKLPPVVVMVGRYLNYKIPETEKKGMTKDDHAARLLGELGYLK